MFCPECESEYRPRVRECTSCGVGLVSALPSKPEPYTGPMSPALRFDTHPEAVAAANLLVDAGVRAFVPEEGWSELGAIGGWRRGEARVWVADGDVTRARRLVEEWAEEERNRERRGIATPDFADYEAAGHVSRYDDEIDAYSRRPSILVRKALRAGAYAINALFLLNVLLAVWPREGGRPAGPTGLPFLLVLVILFVWSRWRASDRY